MSAGAAPTIEPFQRSVDVHFGIGSARRLSALVARDDRRSSPTRCGREALARQCVSRETPSTHQSAIDDQRLVIDER